MLKSLIFSAVLLFSMPVQAQTTAEVLADAALPTDLTDTDILSLARGFAHDKNTDSLTSLILGAGQTRTNLLDSMLGIVAKTHPSAAESVVFAMNQYLPDLGLTSFASMTGYLQQYNQTQALAALNSTNSTLLAQIQNQGLELETAAGPGALNFDSVLEALDIPTENPAQLSSN